MNKTRLLTLIVPVVTGLLFGVAPNANGKDTDVYLMAPGISRDDSPNVLIILDNSGSMETNWIDDIEPYDATKTYTGTRDPAYVYWSNTGDIAQIDGKFPVANNKCTSSADALGAVAGAPGYFKDASKTVGWKWDYSGGTTSTTKGTWAALVDGNNGDGKAKMADVDCSSDDPDDATGKYMSKSINYSGRYTDTWNNRTGAIGTPTLYSANYLNYRASVGTPVSKSRMEIAKGAVKSIIDANRGVRFGLMVFNKNHPSTPQGGRVLFKIGNMDDARRTAMKNAVDTIKGCDNPTNDKNTTCDNKNFSTMTLTPLAETMYEAYLYIGGKKVKYGNPVPAQTPAQDLCAQDAVNAICTQTGTYVSPFTVQCQKTYIIYVTDGEPFLDDDANADIKALTGNTSSDSYLDDLAEYMNKYDVNTDFEDAQTVVTYVVGFGDDLTVDAVKLLKSTASKGGNAGILPNEGFFSANSSAELIKALQIAIDQSNDQTTSFTAPALSVNAFNTLFNRDDVYFAMFQPTAQQRWDGNIKKYSLCNATQAAAGKCTFGEIIDADEQSAVDITTLRIKETAKSYWGTADDGDAVDQGGAGNKLPDPINRKIYTYTGTFATNGITPTGAPVNLAGNTHELKTAVADTVLTPAMFGVATKDERDLLIEWIRGADVYDEDTDGNKTELRGSWRFFDPVHSRPVIVTYGGDNADPIMKIFVGTNDGMLRVINEKTGVEEWAFMPPDLLPNQKALASDLFGEHLWGMDMTPSFDIRDRSKDPLGNVINVPDGIIDPSTGIEDYVHVYIAMRRGGRNIYALDVTPTTKLTSTTATDGIVPKLMWVIRGGTSTGYDALGQTWSRPIVRNVRSGTGTGSGTGAESQTVKALFFGGGFDTANDGVIPAPTTTTGNAIYIADPLTGERIWWAGSDAGATLTLDKMTYSIASDLALMDSNGDSAIDRIYVGDLGGQIWRIDLAPTLKTGSSGYVFADLACTSGSRPDCTGTANQDRRRFYYPPDVAQVNDSIYSPATMSKYDIVTIASGDREDPLDKITYNKVPSQLPVKNRIYALRDYTIKALGTGETITYPATIKESNLVNVTANQLQAASTDEITASGIINSKGWYIDLMDSSGNWTGEKSLAETGIFGGTLFVTTFTPANESTAKVTCRADEGLGQVYALNILTGGASTDFTGNGGALTTEDRRRNVGGGIPSEHVVVIREGGNSDLVGTSAPGAVKKGLQRAKTYWFQ